MKLRILTTLLFLVTLTSCATAPKISPLPCPNYPEFIVIDDELKEATPKVVRAIVTENLLLLDAYAQELEVLAGCKP